LSADHQKKCRGRILIAVDESDHSFRAVEYVGNLLGQHGSVGITLLSILAVPPEDLFESQGAVQDWMSDHRARAEKHLDRCETRLRESGFAGDQVHRKLVTRPCPSIADCILEEQKALGCDTVVITRRGISKKEEFMFGSTSNRILHRATSCAVWVIESDGSDNSTEP